VLTLWEALHENAALKAKLHDLQSLQSSTSSHQQPTLTLSTSSVQATSDDGDRSKLQAELHILQSRVEELERALQDAEGAVTDVVTIVRTRSIHTLEQKIETIQRTIHTHVSTYGFHVFFAGIHKSVKFKIKKIYKLKRLLFRSCR
jgi:hypothetical protein